MSKWKLPKRFVPSKTCPVCERAFRWRRKWARCWHRVVYCGAECRKKAKNKKFKRRSKGAAE